MGPPKRKLDILYVGTLPPHRGGSAVSALSLVTGFASLGHNIRALAPITEQALNNGDSVRKEHPEINVTRYPVPYFETSPTRPAPNFRREIEDEQLKKLLPKLIQDRRPDLIFLGRENFALHVSDIARAYSIATMIRITGGMILGVKHEYYPRSQADQLLDQLRKVDLVVSLAQHTQEILNGMAIDNVVTIPNTVDLKRFSPASKDHSLLKKLNINSDDLVVSHVSNFKTVKRVIDIVQSAEKVLKQIPNIIYLIVGDGESKSKMESACRENRLWDRFRFAGWVDYDEMPNYFRISDIVVMPSEFECQAAVYLEAQACGCTLIASDIPGAREVVNHNDTGLLFRMGDVDDLADMTLRAANDPQLRGRFGYNAPERAREHSLERVLVKYDLVMRDLVSKH